MTDDLSKEHCQLRKIMEYRTLKIQDINLGHYVDTSRIYEGVLESAILAMVKKLGGWEAIGFADELEPYRQPLSARSRP